MQELRNFFTLPDFKNIKKQIRKWKMLFSIFWKYDHKSRLLIILEYGEHSCTANDLYMYIYKFCVWWPLCMVHSDKTGNHSVSVAISKMFSSFLNGIFKKEYCSSFSSQTMFYFVWSFFNFSSFHSFVRPITNLVLRSTVYLKP